MQNVHSKIMCHCFETRVFDDQSQRLGWSSPMPNAAAKATTVETAKTQVYASYILAKLRQERSARTSGKFQESPPLQQTTQTTSLFTSLFHGVATIAEIDDPAPGRCSEWKPRVPGASMAARLGAILRMITTQ